MDLSDTSNPSVPGARMPAGVSSSFQPFSHYVSIITVSILLIICFYACQKDPTAPDDPFVPGDFVEPEMISITEDLIFTMGTSRPVFINESPPHQVELSPFYIGKYEITNEQYWHFVAEGGYLDSIYWSQEGWQVINDSGLTRPSHWDDNGPPWENYEYSNQTNTPIVNITWFEAEAYCNWLSEKTDHEYYLPTEAQWERSARGPDPGTVFPWGNEQDTNKYNFIGIGSINKIQMPVGSYETGKSFDGCYDMAGNALEYCHDWADRPPDYYYQWCYGQGIVKDPEGPTNGTSKIIRGDNISVSSDQFTLMEIRTTNRFIIAIARHASTLGFRVSREY